MPRAALAVIMLALVAGGCGGGGETVDEASQAVAGLIASEDCVRLMDIAGAVPLALGGAVSGAGADAAFLADFASRAPRELAGDVAVVQGALAGLAGRQEIAAPQQASVRASAERLGAWARSSCPG